MFQSRGERVKVSGSGSGSVRRKRWRFGAVIRCFVGVWAFVSSTCKIFLMVVASNPVVLSLVACCPCSSLPPPSPSLSGCKIRFRATTYTRELGATVTALGDGSALLDVQNSEVTTGSLDDSGPVGAGVVAAKDFDSQSLCSARQRADNNSRDNSRIIDRHDRKDSPVTAAVGDSVGRHCCWWCSVVVQSISPREEEFRDLGKFCVGRAARLCPLSWRIRMPLAGCDGPA